MQSRRPLIGALILCVASMVLPAVSQDRSQPQTRPAPGGQSGRPPQGGGNRPSPGNGNRPGGGGGSRPQPSRPNPGTKPPPRPNPGTRPPNRPNPGTKPPARPNPGNRPPSRPNPGNRPPSRPGGRPPQWGQRPPNRPSYSFRPNDRDYLRRRYLSRLSYINRATRPHFVIGGFFPYADIGYLSALPPDVYGYLPPPPPGYSMGYYDGYVVVYDPLTYFIANVVDLLQ
jgi:hypothetical protein